MLPQVNEFWSILVRALLDGLVFVLGLLIAAPFFLAMAAPFVGGL